MRKINKYLTKLIFVLVCSTPLNANNDLMFNTTNGGLLTYQFFNEKEEKNTEKDNNENTVIINTKIFFIYSYFSLLLIAIFFIKREDSVKKIKKLNKKLKRKNKKLKENEKIRLKFFSVISHEFRTPIYGLSSTVQLLKSSQSKEERQKYIDILEYSSNHLNLLASNVLIFSRFNLDEVKANNTRVDIKDLVKKIVEIYQYSATLNHNTIETVIDTKIQPVLVDGTILNQILINLITNAIKYSTSGNILVSVKCIDETETHQKIELSIKDEGNGISPEELSTLFKPFKRLDPDNQKGTGLGLYIVKNLTETLGSEIIIDSKENEGSTFSFTLNCEKAIFRDEKTDIPKSIENHKNILIVDDNKINLILTRKMLENTGFICDTANNGFTAIDKVKHKDFDLILTDINMPTLNGYDTSAEILKIKPKSNIIAFTAMDENEISKKAKKAGILSVINKPIKKNILLEKIAELPN